MKRHTSEQIVHMLREAEVELSKGASVKEVSKKLGITDQTFYRWRKEYGGLRVDQAKRLKELERENGNTAGHHTRGLVEPTLRNIRTSRPQRRGENAPLKQPEETLRRPGPI